MSSVEALLAEGVATHVFPLARAVVLHRGNVAFDGGNARADTLFDVASVTKVMSTTAVCSALIREKALTLDDRVGRFFPHAAAREVTILDLLTHRSGLPAFVPFFAHVQPRPQTVERILAVAPTQPPKTAAVYSDVGFIILGEILSQVAGAPLDTLFTRHVATPLGLTDAGYRRCSTLESLPTRIIAPTGATRPREPAPGQEGMWSVPLIHNRAGEVDDDNAWLLDGVSGHAGLFSTARDVARFGQAVLEGRFDFPLPFEVDRDTPESSRTLGFDTFPGFQSRVPNEGSAAPSKPVIGHLGFTGTSVWVDFTRELVVVLLTNRVALGRANIQIRAFRPRFYEAVTAHLGL